jgi:GTP cyclohydrolase I
MDILENYFKTIITEIGEDTARDGLLQTPKRAAKAIRYLTAGYDADIKKTLNNALFKSDNDEMVIINDIEFYSLCEHHLLPFFGKCHVAYIPSGTIIGLSKIPRIIDIFARRLQVQENLSLQIANAISDATGSADVAVIIDARHMCMMMRGVQKQDVNVRTSSVKGLFKNDSKKMQILLNSIRQIR